MHKSEAQDGRGDEERAPREAGLDAGAGGAHGGAIGQQHVVEQVAEEEPLRNFAGGADRGGGLRRLRQPGPL